MQEIDTFDKKASVISNGLGKHTTFRINKNRFFIESIKFINFSLDALVKK